MINLLLFLSLKRDSLIIYIMHSFGQALDFACPFNIKITLIDCIYFKL